MQHFLRFLPSEHSWGKLLLKWGETKPSVRSKFFRKGVKEEGEIMAKSKLSLISAGIIVFTVLLLHAMERKAGAVASFSRQTGMSCYLCHTVYPELTPFGRSFKLSGYVMSQKGKDNFPPLAAAVTVSQTEQKSLSNRIDPYDDTPDAKTNVPQTATIWYGGKIYDHIGTLTQLTYDGIGNKLFLDMTDIRYANNKALAGTNLIYGMTINNSPTVQDAWNSTPAWGFPQVSSIVAQTPAAAALINGPLSQKVGGIGIYGFWNNLIYGELSVYRTAHKGITRPLSAGTTVNTVTDGAVPYWRLVIQKQRNEHSIAIGTFGMAADVFPAGLTQGLTDRFTDTALDGQYQYIGKQHIFSLQSTFIHEKQSWDASFSLGNTASATDYLNTFRINGNYYYRASFGTIGGSLGFFRTVGTKDSILYAPQDTIGSRTGEPDSRGYIMELDYLPWEKLKISLQYTIYDLFNGSDTNYDGSGRNASDNNTFYLAVTMYF